MSTNINTALAVRAVVAAVGAAVYAFSNASGSSSKNKTFYSASEIGRLVDSHSNSKSATQDGDEFDIVIVGGGTAAMVLANRLTERSDFTVLEIEAEKSGREVPEPGFQQHLPNCKEPNTIGPIRPSLRRDATIAK